MWIEIIDESSGNDVQLDMNIFNKNIQIWFKKEMNSEHVGVSKMRQGRGETPLFGGSSYHNFMDHQKWCKVTPQRPLCDVSKRLMTSLGHNDKNAADLFHDARNGPLLSS